VVAQEQGARRLKEHSPDRPEGDVSDQTLYRAIDLLPRGELKHGLIPCLRRDGRPDRTAGDPSVSHRPWIERLVTEPLIDAEHRRLTAAIGIQGFFYPSHRPWARPGGENVHGLIRASLPKAALG
jgi:hypothetical protein